MTASAPETASSMRTEEQRLPSGLGGRSHHGYASALEIGDDPWVVDEGTERMDRPLGIRDGLFGHSERAFHAIAGTSLVCSENPWHGRRGA